MSSNAYTDGLKQDYVRDKLSEIALAKKKPNIVAFAKYKEFDLTEAQLINKIPSNVVRAHNHGLIPSWAYSDTPAVGDAAKLFEQNAANMYETGKSPATFLIKSGETSSDIQPHRPGTAPGPSMPAHPEPKTDDDLARMVASAVDMSSRSKVDDIRRGIEDYNNGVLSVHSLSYVHTVRAMKPLEGVTGEMLANVHPDFKNLARDTIAIARADVAAAALANKDQKVRFAARLTNIRSKLDKRSGKTAQAEVDPDMMLARSEDVALYTTTEIIPVSEPTRLVIPSANWNEVFATDEDTATAKAQKMKMVKQSMMSTFGDAKNITKEQALQWFGWCAGYFAFAAASDLVTVSSTETNDDVTVPAEAEVIASNGTNLLAYVWLIKITKPDKMAYADGIAVSKLAQMFTTDTASATMLNSPAFISAMSDHFWPGVNYFQRRINRSRWYNAILDAVTAMTGYNIPVMEEIRFRLTQLAGQAAVKKFLEILGNDPKAFFVLTQVEIKNLITYISLVIKERAAVRDPSTDAGAAALAAANSSSMPTMAAIGTVMMIVGMDQGNISRFTGLRNSVNRAVSSAQAIGMYYSLSTQACMDIWKQVFKEDFEPLPSLQSVFANAIAGNVAECQVWLDVLEILMKNHGAFRSAIPMDQESTAKYSTVGFGELNKVQGMLAPKANSGTGYGIRTNYL